MQVNGIRDSIKTMTNSTPHLPTTADRAVAANDKYLASETQMQEQIIRSVGGQLCCCALDNKLVQFGQKRAMGIVCILALNATS